VPLTKLAIQRSSQCGRPEETKNVFKQQKEEGETVLVIITVIVIITEITLPVVMFSLMSKRRTYTCILT